MKKSRHPFLLLLTVAFCMEFFLTGTVCYADTEAKEVGNLYALSAVLMDGDSGRILYAKNGEEKRPMASTTKIMTCKTAAWMKRQRFPLMRLPCPKSAWGYSLRSGI